MITIECFKNGQFSDAIEKYREKTKDFDDFIFENNGKILNSEMSILDLGFNDYDIIDVISQKNKIGGQINLVKFTDVNKNEIKELGV